MDLDQSLVSERNGSANSVGRDVRRLLKWCNRRCENDNTVYESIVPVSSAISF